MATRSYCAGVCYRLRHVLWRAPLSTFDLALSLGLMAMGGYLLYSPEALAKLGSVYASMVKYADLDHWALLFVVLSGFSVVVNLWPFKPAFYWRLMARMGVAFCILSLALNNLANKPPYVSGFMYGVLALFAVWSVLRVRCDGG